MLLALCKAAPQVQDLEHADKLLTRLSPYFLEAHVQLLAPSPSLKALEPSPWECLTQCLTAGVLSIGLNHESLRRKAIDAASNYLENCLDTIATIPTLGSSSDSQEMESLGHEDLSMVALITVSP